MKLSFVGAGGGRRLVETSRLMRHGLRVGVHTVPPVAAIHSEFSEATRSLRFRHWILFAAAALVPVSFRLVLWLEDAFLFSVADLQGVYVDCCVAAVWTLLVMVAGSKSRIAAYALGVLWCLLHAANYEHVRALGTLPLLDHAGQLAEPAFLWGSVAVVSRPWLLAALLALTLGATRLFCRASRLDRTAARFACCILALGLALPWCQQREQTALWRQTHPLALNVARLWNRAEPARDTSGPISPELRDRIRGLTHADLNGVPIAAAQGSRPQNVLLLILEGVSGAHVQTICRAQGVDTPSPMPQLSKWAADNLAWTQFVSQQRQTNRGLYTIMTGRYPQLNSSAPLMASYDPVPGRPALPSVLRDAGYETVFLQAADLEFMKKGRFMQAAGFNRVMGSESFQTCRFRTNWGPDDLSVMDKGYELVRELNQQAKPWFLTVFTVGTHHPYKVPGEFTSEFKRGTFEHAAAYADAAVASLLSRLEHDGSLANTLVLITSDESSGIRQAASDVDCEVSQNWGFLIAITPDGIRQQVHEPFMQCDLALSVVDYLGLADRPHRFVGRSAFRAYDRPRPIFCGNVYFGSVTLFDTDGSLYICPYDFHAGRRYRVPEGHLFGGGKSPQAWDDAETDFMLAMVRYSNKRGACRSLARRPAASATY
jgi:hypothetical protein